MELKADYRGELAQRVRLHMGYTQKQMAAMFGLSLRSWQDKEQNTNRVSVAELLMFQLLLDEHPDYLLIPRISDELSPVRKAAQEAFRLARYLFTPVPLPSKAEALRLELSASIDEFKADWLSDIDKAVGDSLPDDNKILRVQQEDALTQNEILKQKFKEK